ncbi:Hypothetical predicted protein [Pelobates cultripes]|uniref:Uncharacterized protein n=1 Tax=Pelobates cultripes TaxID=61616 RepID=A0AAD1R792_PELCU|nr:Hypothetical predicted protein [Pelobates cultripes]
MAKARSRPTWRFQDADVALYQDLSPLTLEARRALRPITTQLQERRITYKWGYPFALLARHQNEWVPLRWPEEAPRFLQRLGLPPTEITNWILSQPEQRSVPQTPRQQRRRREETPRRPVDRRQLEPGQLAQYKRSILRHLLNAAKALIPARWKQTQPPTKMEWLQRIEEIHTAEARYAEILGRRDKHLEMWTPWYLYTSQTRTGDGTPRGS